MSENEFVGTLKVQEGAESRNGAVYRQSHPIVSTLRAGQLRTFDSFLGRIELSLSSTPQRVSHSASCFKFTGGPRGLHSRYEKLTTYSHLLPRLRLRGVLPPLSTMFL